MSQRKHQDCVVGIAEEEMNTRFERASAQRVRSKREAEARMIFHANVHMMLKDGAYAQPDTYTRSPSDARRHEIGSRS